MNNHPTGTVTFLFTDIEGSTNLAREHPQEWEGARAHHHAILREAIESNHGYVFQIIGDAFCVAFHTAGDALTAAIQAQHSLQTSEVLMLRVRMGLHTGSAEIQSDGQYRGYLTLSMIQRVMSAGHGGQILLSSVTENLLRDSLSKDVSLRDMGEHKLKDVPQPVRIFQVVAPDLQSEFPAIKTQDVRPSNLPVQLTDFIGREKELSEIAEALAQNRLVTLIGSGGTGKTRLAIEAGAMQLSENHFFNGVYFVALAPLETIGAIVPTIASALGFSFYEGGEPRKQLLDYLREKSMLLIMDNFEHLLSGVDIVIEILNTAPQVKILVTSRARLNVQGEQLFHLSGMDFPNWEAPQDASEYGAVKLFTQTARRVHLDFELTPDSLKYITRICRLVEGMPLGILLAASWIEMLAPEEIATEIERSLDFLETDRRDVPERQHSMRAVFDYSWKLLTPGEQNVFMRSSVFRGGFTREAAEQVAGASLRDLMGLVDKSLLQRDSNGRYQIHELLRQYGAERLSGSSEVEQTTRDFHCSYFAEYLHKREPDLHGKDQQVILAEIETEIENIKIGWDWAIEHLQIERLTNYLECVFELYDSRSWSQEGTRLFALAAQRLSNVMGDDREVQILYNQLLLRQYISSFDIEPEENLKQLLQTALTAFRKLGVSRELAIALSYNVINSYYFETTNEIYGQESLGIFKEMGDRHGIAFALKALARSALLQENYPLAKERYQSSLAILRELGDTKEIVRCLNTLGYTYWRMGEYQEAKQNHDESLALSKNAGDLYGTATALAHLAQDASFGLKDNKQGVELCKASLEIFKEIGSTLGVAGQLGDMAEFMLMEKEYPQALNFAEEARDIYYSSLGAESDIWEGRIIGGAAVGMGDVDKAKTYLCKSLQQSVNIQRLGYALLTLIEVARLFVMQGNGEYALELLALIMSHRASWQMAKDKATSLITELENELPPEIVEQAKERGRARDLERTIQELLEELKEES